MERETKKKPTPPPGPYPMSLLAPSRVQNDLFWQGFRTSAGAHAVLAIAVIILSLTLAREPIKILPSIRVDIVGLPDLKKSDMIRPAPSDDLASKLNEASKASKKLLESAKKAPPAVPDDSSMALKHEKEKPVEKKIDKRQDLKSAIDRIKALADLDTDDKKAGKKKSDTLKGNQVSKGNSTSGPVAQSADEFFGRLQSKMRENWNLPVWLSNQHLSANIVIFLDRGGYVSNTVVAKSSGNKQFDDYCLKTIRLSQPFGAPPDDVVQEGITLGFPL